MPDVQPPADPVIVTITMDAAAHVLAQEGLAGGYPPGQYIGRLLTAWWSADPDHAARLAAAYPVYGAAIALLHTLDGPALLHRIATGQSTCRTTQVDGEPIRVFTTGDMSDEDAATLIEGVADMRRRGKATEHAGPHAPIPAAWAEPVDRRRAAGPSEPDDACRLVEVDGEQVLVRGAHEMTEQDRSALAEVIAAARRRYAAQHDHDTQGA